MGFGKFANYSVASAWTAVASTAAASRSNAGLDEIVPDHTTVKASVVIDAAVAAVAGVDSKPE